MASHTKRIQTSIASVLVLGLLLFILFKMFYGFYLNILLGLVFAIFLRPLHLKLTSLFKGKKRLAALSTLLLTIILVLIPLFILLNIFADEAISYGKNFGTNTVSIENRFDSAINDVNFRAEKVIGRKDLIKKEDAVNFIQDKATGVGQRLLGTLTNFFSVIAGSVILFMTIYYSLSGWDELRTYVYTFSPLSPEATLRLSSRALTVIRAALRGNIVMIFVQAFAGGTGFFLFGLRSPVLLGALYGLASLVPTIGTGTIWIPSVIYLFITGNYISGIGLMFWNMAIVGSLDNFVMPMLVKRGASLHPFLVLIGVLGGLHLFGLVGFILGPTIIALTLISIELLKENAQHNL